MIGACFRCGQVASLCKSHVIPEGALRPIYDEENSRGVTISSETGKHRSIQQGVWQYMFCRRCENFFNAIETPFIRFWNHSKTFPAKLQGAALALRGVDYEVTKRFLLSILWRAHVTTREEFKGVDLGPHADKIAALLSSESPIPPLLYPAYCYVLYDPTTGGANREVVVTPVFSKLHGQINYLMAFLGVAWMVFVTSHAVPLPNSCMLQPGEAQVIPIIPTSHFGPIAQVFAQMQRADA